MLSFHVMLNRLYKLYRVCKPIGILNWQTEAVARTVQTQNNFNATDTEVNFSQITGTISLH
jgi:hypothetical protein